MSPWTLRDFRYDSDLKIGTDKRVEEEVIRRLDQLCNESKRKRQSYLSQSKKYSEQEDVYQKYIDQAESVDMTPCSKLKEDKELID